MPTRERKRRSSKSALNVVDRTGPWVVQLGVLKPSSVQRSASERLFRAVGEKIPFSALGNVKRALQEHGLGVTGVYMAHDSMGAVRYVGRGNIFQRLSRHLRAHRHELLYFSFFVVANKQHEREIETLLIRGAGPLLEFNDRKKRVGIEPGDVRDFEAGTHYVRRRPVRRQKKKWLFSKDRVSLTG